MACEQRGASSIDDMIGPAGLTALKYLREEGFQAVGFDRRDKIGGIWNIIENKSFTSTLDETVSNISKFVVGVPGVSRGGFSNMLTVFICSLALATSPYPKVTVFDYTY
jgi:hypothetical protein